MCRCGADGEIPPTAEHLETGTMQDAGLINKHDADAGVVTRPRHVRVRVVWSMWRRTKGGRD